MLLTGRFGDQQAAVARSTVKKTVFMGIFGLMLSANGVV
jgi:hypothetical protein